MLDCHSIETQAHNESLENAHAIKMLSKDPKTKTVHIHEETKNI